MQILIWDEPAKRQCRSRGHLYITAKTDSNKQALTFTSTFLVKFIVSNRPCGLQCPGCLKPMLACKGHSAWKGKEAQPVGVEIENTNFMLSVTNLKSQLWTIKNIPAEYWKRLCPVFMISCKDIIIWHHQTRKYFPPGGWSTVTKKSSWKHLSI